MQKKGEGEERWKTSFRAIEKQPNLPTSTNLPSLLCAAAVLGTVICKRDTLRLNTKAILISY